MIIVFRRNPARLLPIGPRVAVEKSRRELLYGRHLLLWYVVLRWIHQSLEQDPFATFGPPCCG